MRSNDPELRARAVLALGRYPEHAEEKLPIIIESLDDPIANVRNHAARAICCLGQFADPDRNIFDADTSAMLITAFDRIESDRLIDVDTDWLGRIRGWLRRNE